MMIKPRVLKNAKPASTPAWRESLGKTSIFAGFTLEQIDQLAELGSERRMHQGEMLMRTGDPGEFMMIVTLGEVRVQLSSAAGQIQVLNTLGTGAVIGEIALFDGQTRTADVVAASNGRVAVIERAAVLRLLAQNPPFALSAIAGLCAKLRDTLAQLEAMVFQDVATRLATAMLRLAQGTRPRQLDMTQEQLGRLVGASREIVNKRLRKLAADGVLQLAPGRIVLLDEARLVAMVAAATN